MLSQQEIISRLFLIKTETEFNDLAISIFQHQIKHNSVYEKYVCTLAINTNEISHYSKIPCLPISFFKSQLVAAAPSSSATIAFTSSGTSGQITSKHLVTDITIYEKSYNAAFNLFYGNPEQYCILALLPNYLERNGSSLVYMFNDLITKSKHNLSGFYLNNSGTLIQTINTLKKRKQKTILLGVTYALLDLAEANCKLNEHFIVMETGGMKGKRPEMIKEELHSILKKKFHINAIHSEYGMTELLSQAYSNSNGIFNCPPWMRVLIRDTNDPFYYLNQNKSGGINIIDLANINSCSFIETKDLGKHCLNNSFEILGRFDNSDIRGCNLMIE